MKHGHRLLTIGLMLAILAVASILISAGGQPSLALDGVLYVNAEATGPLYDGSTWDTAFTGLQAALDVVGSGQEIWVATGVYTPTLPFDAGDPRSATFQMKNGVAIYGGFDPSMGDDTWEDRDRVANPTILSGDLNGDDLPEFANREDNSYHVFYHPDGMDLDDTATLDGFTISGGNANGLSDHNYGGGMYNHYSSPSLANCAFQDNSTGYYGGGMYNKHAAPALTNVTFEGNLANNAGGGMANFSDSSPTLIDCAFVSNQANSLGGGGMHNSSSSPALNNCAFEKNVASFGGGGMRSDSSSPTLANCTFSNNSAEHGGGMYNTGSSGPTLTNCTFTGNSADYGGGINNYYTGSVLTLTGCSFTDNLATYGGGIYNNSSEVALTNCILWGDTGSEIHNYDSSAVVSYCDIEGDLYPGTGNINEDPDFVDAANGDLRLQLTSPAIDAGDNKAVPITVTADRGGNPRFADVDSVTDTGNGTPPIVDMGAYEAPPELIFVDQDAAGEDDGSSWDNAFADLQDALGWAQEGVEIRVAEGTYKPTSGSDRTASFRMRNGVGIYGGFDPSTGAVAFEDRNWVLYETILSGDIGTEGDPADNSYHVFHHPEGTNLDSSAILDGFTITGGNADGEEPIFQNSGGGFFNYASSPALVNLTISGNSASGSGAGMHNTSGSSPALSSCTFQGNTAGTEGGGMHNDGSSPTLTGCTFSENTADAGGGIYNGEGQPELINCTFAGNHANSGGGMHNDSSSPVLVNCIFKGNSAGGNGGGLRNTRSSTPTLTNCTFHGNTATNGGAIHNYDNSPPTITNCILWGDTKPEIFNFDSGSTANVTYSDIQDGGYLSHGNIDADPLFLDPDNGDFHLLPGSPCIDAGTNDAPLLPGHDFEGDPRSLDGDRDGTATADMGVDEALWHPVYLPLVLKMY